jgi:hypothetical protein
MFHIRCAKLQDVIRVILSKKCRFINRYTAVSILVYVCGCNQEFYNKYLLSYCTNKKEFVGHITKDRYPLSQPILQHVSGIAINKASNEVVPSVCVTSNKNYVPDNTMEERHQFLFMLPS